MTKLLNAAGGWLYQRLAGSRLLRRRALRKYRKGLLDATGKISVPFRPNRPLILDDAYVPLRLAGDAGDRKKDATELLADHPRVVVTGPPGAGKSMLLRHLASTSALVQGVGRKQIPVLVELHRLVRDAEQGSSIEAHLIDAFARYGFPRATKFVRAAIAKGWLILLFDGLDEVPAAQRVAVAGELSDFLTQERSCPAVITCRTAVYRGELDAVCDRIVELEPFEDQQIQAFLRSWRDHMPVEKSPAQLMAALREQPKLLAAARNPLLLTVIAHLYSDTPTYVLPRSRADFYRQAARILLGQWQGHLGQNKFDAPEKETVLSRLSLGMQESAAEDDGERRTISRERAIKLVKETMPDLGRDSGQVGELMQEIVERSGLLLSIDGGARYAFSHLTFQEYFAAEASLNRLDRLKVQFATEPDAWREVVLLWCGLVDDCTVMLEWVGEIDEEAALLCVAEARSAEQKVAAKILDPIIADVIIGRAEVKTCRALGAVAADVRPRGDAVLTELIKALGESTGSEQRNTIAMALAASNRVPAAEAVVEALAVEPVLSTYVIELGDLAVESLVSSVEATGGTLICECLAKIATPDAARALVEIMLENGANATEAAWGVASVVSSAAVTSEIASIKVSDHQRRGRQSLDWIWIPFAEPGQSSLSWIIGRAAALVRDTSDEDQAIANPDARISTALCAINPEPLATSLREHPPDEEFIAAANATIEGFELERGADGRIVARNTLPSLLLTREMRPQPRSMRKVGVELLTYRRLLGRMVASHNDQIARLRSRPRETEPVSAQFAKLIDQFLDQLGQAGIWMRLMRGIEAPLRCDLLIRLADSSPITPQTWPAVRSMYPFEFGRSLRYACLLAGLVVWSAIAIWGGFLLLGKSPIGSLQSLLALAACGSMLVTWGWLRFGSFPTTDYGGVDSTALLVALTVILGPSLFFDALRLKTVDGEDLVLLVTLGFVPGLCWLSIEALSSMISPSHAVMLIGTVIAIGVSMIVTGQRKEMAARTPMLGLFLREPQAELAD